MGATVLNISRKKTIRPPKRSVQIPSGTLINDPVSTGMAASKPNSVSFRPSCSLIGMPMTANIIQTAKQIVKAKVLEVSAIVEVRVGELIMCLNCS